MMITNYVWSLAIYLHIYLKFKMKYMNILQDRATKSMKNLIFHFKFQSNNYLRQTVFIPTRD